MKKKRALNRWKYKNLFLAGLGIIVALFLYRFEAFHVFLMQLGDLGYIGAFIAGMFFAFTFTVATSILVLLLLAETLSPIEIGLIAGLGAVVGDLVILRIFKDNFGREIEEIYKHVDRKRRLKKLFHSKYFGWTLPVVGAIVIASPLPDELGVSLMGITKMSAKSFMLLSYTLNSVGIFIVVSVTKVLE